MKIDVKHFAKKALEAERLGNFYSKGGDLYNASLQYHAAAEYWEILRQFAGWKI